MDHWNRNCGLDRGYRISALMRTASAQAWFGDMLKQSPNLMKIQGIGFAFIALIILMNLIFPPLSRLRL